jgi:hypothetical protein
MKLHLVLLASLLNLSIGFMAEIRGPLTAVECTGGEYADFKNCVTQGVAADPNLGGLIDIEDVAIVNRGGERKLNCRVCPHSAPRGTYCFTMCGSTGRRRLEEATDTPNLRRVQEDVDTAVFQGGAYTGNVESILILGVMTTCLDDGLTRHPCLGATGKMTLTVTL